jgi:hypothetical protein
MPAGVHPIMQMRESNSRFLGRLKLEKNDEIRQRCPNKLSNHKKESLLDM